MIAAILAYLATSTLGAIALGKLIKINRRRIISTYSDEFQ